MFIFVGSTTHNKSLSLVFECRQMECSAWVNLLQSHRQQNLVVARQRCFGRPRLTMLNGCIAVVLQASCDFDNQRQGHKGALPQGSVASQRLVLRRREMTQQIGALGKALAEAKRAFFQRIPSLLVQLGYQGYHHPDLFRQSHGVKLTYQMCTPMIDAAAAADCWSGPCSVQDLAKSYQRAVRLKDG